MKEAYEAIADFTENQPGDAKDVYFDWFVFTLATVQQLIHSLLRRRWKDGASIGRVSARSLLYTAVIDHCCTQTVQSHHSYVHRARFLDTMLAAMPSCVGRHFKKRFRKWTEEGDSLTLLFADETTAQAHCIVGCDGIHSSVRAVNHPPDPTTQKSDVGPRFAHPRRLDAKSLTSMC